MTVQAWFTLWLLICSSLASGNSLAADHPPVTDGPSSIGKPSPTRVVVYRDDVDPPLKLHLFLPVGHEPGAKRSAIVFFYGGGWVSGSPSQFYPQCADLAERGMVAISADYRVKRTHGVTPFECVEDGRAAIAFLRRHAERLGIDPSRICAAGGSAGGHVAACTACRADPPDATGSPDATELSVPNALALFNPVIDTGPNGFGYRTLNERYREISPIEHVRPGLPATIVFQGDADKTTPPQGHLLFQRKMILAGNVCELVLFPGAGHGFFNPGRGDGSGYRDTSALLRGFLVSIDFLDLAALGDDPLNTDAATPETLKSAGAGECQSE